MNKNEIVSIVGLFIFIIGVALYVSPQPSLTGNLIKENKRSNYFYGVYSFAPSFKVQTNLDFSVYDNIAKDLKVIIDCVAAGQSTDACVNNRQFTKELSWEFDCDVGEERVFYDLAKLYDDCMNSPDTNCLCSASFDDGAYIKRNALSGKTYKIKLSTENEKQTLTNDGSLQSYKLPDFLSIYSPLNFTFRYDTDKLNTMFSYNKEGQDKFFLTSENKIMLLKSKNGDKTTLELVGKQGEDIYYPNSVPIQLSGFPTATPPSCQKPKQNIERFCVTDQRKKYLVYDDIEEKVVEKPITIKFAAHLPDTPPAQIKNIEVRDMPKASKSVIVSWDATAASDAVFYKIYAGTPEILQSTPTAQLSGKLGITTFQLSDATPLAAIPPFETCTFNPQTKTCSFGESTTIQKGKLYSTPNDEKQKLFTVVSIQEDKEYGFSVTAVDSNGNEIDNIKEQQKLPVVLGTSVDDLPPLSEGTVPLLANLANAYDKDTKTVTFPTFKLSSQNIDRSIATDVKDIIVYYKKNAPATPTKSQKLEYFESEIIPIMQDGKLLVIFNDAQQNDVYSLIVVARDNLENPKKEKFTAEEIGTTILELPIT